MIWYFFFSCVKIKLIIKVGGFMDKIDPRFKVDYKNALAEEKAIIKGKFYRFTILSETLIRLEYDTGSVFEDRPTELALDRHFAVPEYKIQENNNYIVITTKYFRLQYLKDKPFTCSMFAPDANLRVSLNDTDKTWYYGHDEARNFGGYENILDTKEPYVTQAEKILAA